MSSDSDGGTIPSGSPPPNPVPQPPAAPFATDPHPPIEAPAGAPTGPPPGPGAPPAEEKKHGSFIRELPVLILIAFGLALLIKSFLIQAFYIPSESMVPTLNIGDRVLVNKVVYKIRDPRRGEVIVFAGENRGAPRTFWQRVRDTLTSGLGGKQGPEQDYIKRIIGLPGETVQIDAGRVTITKADGSTLTLDEPYLAEQKDTQSYGPYTVPAKSYFVMGDNRANSSDSRSSLGFIEENEIIGRAFVRIWPLRRFHRLNRPSYALALPWVMMPRAFAAAR